MRRSFGSLDSSSLLLPVRCYVCHGRIGKPSDKVVCLQRKRGPLSMGALGACRRQTCTSCSTLTIKPTGAASFFCSIMQVALTMQQKRVYFAMCEKQGFLISMFLFFFPSLTNSPDPDVAWHQRLYDTWLMQTAQGFFVSAFARNPKRMDKLLPRSIPSYSKPKGWASEEKKIPTNTGFSMPRVPICSRGCGIWAVWMKPQRSNETETAAA